MSKTLEPEDSKKDKEKTFYIFFFFSNPKEIEIAFKFNSNKTEQIHFSKQNINKLFRYSIVLKHIFNSKNSSEIIDLSFNNNKQIFKVSFSPNQGTFIFNPTLKIKKDRTSDEKTISQNVVKITDKIDIFSKCLEEKKEKSKIETLYSDSVDFFNSSKDFELLIYLFTKICGNAQNFKDICKRLLDIFWSLTSIDKINELNNQDEGSKKYLDMITKIASNSDKYISENGFDKSKFYGLILYYLNTYDHKQYQSFSKKLQEQKEKDNFFFNILVQYSSTFSNEDNVPLEKYVDYLTGKDFKKLEISGFAYFKQIEDFFHVINTKKEKLIKMTDFKALKIPKHLNYKFEDPDKFIKELEDILDFSKKQKKLMLYLSGTFWKQMSEVLGKPTVDNICNLFQLRVNFKKYLKVVKELYKPENTIYKNGEETEQKDEIAFILNRIIQKNIEEEKEITNDQIINQITQFDIYYQEDIYKDRRELYFLDKINFDDTETEWMGSFKKRNFEEIFSKVIDNYLLKLVSKIKKMEHLGIVIDIINEDKIKSMDKIEFLLDLLRRKALNLMKNSDSMKEPNMKKEKLQPLTKLCEIIYKYSQNFEKIHDIFNKLDNESKHLVYLKLLKSFNDNKPLQESIFDFYINNINIFYKHIVDLFGVLNEENIKHFMSKISDKKEEKKKNYRVISYEDFFMEKENLNLNLLKELYKKIDLIKHTVYYGDCKVVLEQVYDNIFKKKLGINHLKTLLLNSRENVLKRFELLNILNKPFKPEDTYEDLKKKYEKAKEEIKELERISEAFKVFHKEFYKKEIKQIEEAIEKFNKGEIKEFDNISKIKLILEEDLDIKNKVEKINKIKYSSIFKKLFENTQGKNQDDRFEIALKGLYNEFLSLKKKSKPFDERTKKELNMIIDVLGLKGMKKLKRN